MSKTPDELAIELIQEARRAAVEDFQHGGDAAEYLRISRRLRDLEDAVEEGGVEVG